MQRTVLDHPATYPVVAAVMTAAAFFEAGYGGPDAGYTPVSVANSLTVGVAILVSRRFPLAAIVVLLAEMAVPALFTELPPTGGAQLITTMLLVGHAAYRLPRKAGLVAYVLAASVSSLAIIVAGETVWELAFYALILAPAWLVGRLLRREQERSAELLRLSEALRLEREKHAEVAVAAERTRISRELHDAVAHTVSVMTLQVGVVRRRIADREVEADTLQRAELLGRQAVDELRRIVGLVLEDDEAGLAPLPSLAHLDGLVTDVRAGGTPLEAEVVGDLASVPPAVDMSAYRIVQEALTNALRHAPGAPVRIRVVAGPADVRLEIRNGAATGPARRTASGGTGLPGMRERASVLGGTLEAGPDRDGFLVRASLPLSPVQVAGSPA